MNYAARMARLGTETAFEVLARAQALEAQGKSVVHLEIGEPDFDTPKHIRQAAIDAMQQYSGREIQTLSRRTSLALPASPSRTMPARRGRRPYRPGQPASGTRNSPDPR